MPIGNPLTTLADASVSAVPNPTICCLGMPTFTAIVEPPAGGDAVLWIVPSSVTWSGMPPGPAEREVWKTWIAEKFPPLVPPDDDPLPLPEPLAPDEAPLEEPGPDEEPLPPEDEPPDPEEWPASAPDDEPEELLPAEASPPEDDEASPGLWAAVLQPM
jgi:hypothetical protein